MSPLTITAKRLYFNFNIQSTAITVLLLALFVYLGCWQLSRMSEKTKLEEQLARSIHTPAIPWTVDSEWTRFQKLKVKGHFLNDKNFLLDNRIFKNQVGYKVLTPFLCSSTQQLFLIDRGFIPLGKHREELPSIPVIDKEVELIGLLNTITPGFTLKKETILDAFPISWPLRIQTVNMSDISRVLKQEVFPFLLTVTERSPYSFVITEIPVGLNANRHLGYALQWFTMAAALFIYYWVTHCKRQ